MTTNEGEQLAMAGMADTLAAETAAHHTFEHYAQAAIARFIRERREFDAEDIRREIPAGVTPHHPNVIGALIGQCSRRGDIEVVGRRKATRKARHANTNCVWRRRDHGQEKL